MRATEEIEPCTGDQYKLEVNEDHYNFYWKMKGAFFLLYRFERDVVTGKHTSYSVPWTRLLQCTNFQASLRPQSSQ